MSQKPPRSKPYPVQVQAGNIYYWCACGKSRNLPFCDGSHHGSGVSPLPHKAESDGTIHFCGCRKTRKPPYCDGSHDRCKEGPGAS
ncbi:MAG: CDGSH iron-sulfur domain-containing protein [Opitutia bacterium]|jgi:CDGSH-type Zn-finger protein